MHTKQTGMHTLIAHILYQSDGLSAPLIAKQTKTVRLIVPAILCNDGQS